MTTDQWIAVASIAAVLVSAIAIVVALTSVRDQLQVTVFLTYMDRYTRAMHDLPFEARRPGIEYPDRRRPGAVWEKGMQQVARFPCFGEMWESLSFEYE